jgi:hypothetical protein
MHLPPLPSFLHPKPTEPPAEVRIVARGDVQWNRPVFRAPPLAVRVPAVDARLFRDEWPSDVFGPR